MPFKSGFVTVIGVPNAGKSSLVNALVKETVTIVTAKPQTTRKRTMGILNKENEYQIIFVDTPGVIESDAGLNSYLKTELNNSLKDVDVVVAAVAPWEFQKEEKPWALKVCEKFDGKVIYIATQTDKKSPAPDHEARLTRWNTWTENTPLLETSSRNREGVEELKLLVIEKLPEGPQYYDVDLFTPQTMREMTGEVIRKQCFELLHQEIPYGLAVLIRTFEEGNCYKVEGDIIVSKDSHKGMVIGKGGGVLKQIGTRARFELERMFNHKMNLKLHVVVKPAWIKDRQYLQELGYVSEK